MDFFCALNINNETKIVILMIDIKNEIDILQKLVNIIKIFVFYYYNNYYFIITEFYKYRDYIFILKKNIQKNNYVFYFIKFFLVYVIYMKIILFI